MDAEAFDATFAEAVGPYLRTYVAARLAERDEPADLEALLAELFAGLVATDTLVHQGTRASFGARLYGRIDAVLPHLARPGLRRPLDPDLLARGRRFVEAVAAQWHGGFQEHLDALLALGPREREAILLRDFHALSMHELGARLGLEREAARAFVAGVRAGLRPRARGTA